MMVVGGVSAGGSALVAASFALAGFAMGRRRTRRCRIIFLRKGMCVFLSGNTKRKRMPPPPRSRKPRKGYVQAWVQRIGPQIIRAINKPIAQAIAIPLIGFGATALLAARGAVIDEPLDKIFDRLGVPPDNNIRAGLKQYVHRQEEANNPPEGFVFERYPGEDAVVRRGTGRRRALSNPIDLNIVQALNQAPHIENLADLEANIDAELQI
jgi:hypothetical protein